MTARFKVAAPLVYLKVPDALGVPTFVTFYAGAPVPENVDPDSLAHHIDGGMVVEDDSRSALAVPAGTPVEPDEKWTVDELRAYAEQHSVDLSEATKKAEILAAIDKAKQV